MSVPDRDRAARIRSAVRESGTCNNTSRYHLDRIERAVISGMAAQLAQPEAIAAYLQPYNDERKRLCDAATRSPSRLVAKLAQAERELEPALKALIKGRLSDPDADRLLPPLRAERDRLKAELLAIVEPPKLVAPHPAAVASYLASVERLAASLAGHAASPRGIWHADRRFPRTLVSRVTVHPTDKSFDVAVEGKLAALIGSEALPSNVGVLW